MDRDKLIELIKKGHEIELKDYPADNYTEATLNIESLADHLIANGIGDITAEKHRADVAEEALNGLCINCEKQYVKFLLQQAEERLRERK